MEIKTNGIELDICDNNGVHKGDLVITKTQVVWCPGRTTPANGIQLSWEEFIAYMQERR
jgi:hypothetical protein